MATDFRYLTFGANGLLSVQSQHFRVRWRLGVRGRRLVAVAVVFRGRRLGVRGRRLVRGRWRLGVRGRRLVAVRSVPDSHGRADPCVNIT